MYLIYSIDLCSLNVKIYDYANLHEHACELLQKVATQFIKVEHGEKRAENCFKDSEIDSQITEDGYFLRNCSLSNDIINVYKRTTNIVKGSIWGSTVSVNVEKVMRFGIVQAGLQFEMEYSDKIIKKPILPRYQSSLHDAVIQELKIKLSLKDKTA